MRKSYVFVTIGIGLIVVISGWALFLNKTNPIVSKGEIEIPQEDVKEVIYLIVDDQEEQTQTIEIEFREGLTAFDVLEEGAQGLGLPLKIKNYDIGVFIEAIGDKENGEGYRYWLFYINDEMPTVSADNKEVKPGDKIEFRFEESPF